MKQFNDLRISSISSHKMSLIQDDTNNLNQKIPLWFYIRRISGVLLNLLIVEYFCKDFEDFIIIWMLSF